MVVQRNIMPCMVLQKLNINTSVKLLKNILLQIIWSRIFLNNSALVFVLNFWKTVHGMIVLSTNNTITSITVIIKYYYILLLLLMLLLLSSIQLRFIYSLPNHILFHVSAFHKPVTWFFHDCNGFRLLLLPCGIHWQIFFSQWLSSIVRRCPYNFNCLLWIQSKTYRSAWILLLMVDFDIFL